MAWNLKICRITNAVKCPPLKINPQELKSNRESSDWKWEEIESVYLTWTDKSHRSERTVKKRGIKSKMVGNYFMLSKSCFLCTFACYPV